MHTKKGGKFGIHKTAESRYSHTIDPDDLYNITMNLRELTITLVCNRLMQFVESINALSTSCLGLFDVF